MSACIRIPKSTESAARELESTFGFPLETLSKSQFVHAWCALSYLEPGLHPDDFDQPGSGWPDDLKRFAAEAWRREEAGELTDEEMYPSDASWAGLYDKMHTHTVEETTRRFRIAADYGEV